MQKNLNLEKDSDKVFSRDFFTIAKAEEYALSEIAKGNDASVWKYLNGKISVLVQIPERIDHGS